MSAPIQLLHSVDPRRVMSASIEPYIRDIQIRPFDVMLASYLRERMPGEKITKTGIIVPDNGVGSLREDLHQGKVGLVMMVGARAFTDSPDNKWEGFKPQVGDWVAVRVSDTFWWDIPGGWRIRIIDENYIQAILPDPDMVF